MVPGKEALYQGTSNRIFPHRPASFLWDINLNKPVIQYYLRAKGVLIMPLVFYCRVALYRITFVIGFFSTGKAHG
jgi:hypothetical protein